MADSRRLLHDGSIQLHNTRSTAMDKLYKPHFLSQLKVRIAAELSDFVPHMTPPAGHPFP